MPTLAKYITLCADDYALHKAVSEGILHLAAMERLTAVNCLSTMPDWPEHAKWLYPYRDKLDVGLHFNLTEGRPLCGLKSLVTRKGTFRSLTAWLLATHLRQVKQADIECELSEQLERFTTHWQRLPDFIDGHQYVHQLPVVRDALLNVYERKLRSHRPYIRVSLQRGGGLKPLVVAATGAKALSKQLLARHIPHNTAFSGIYPFQNARDYRPYFLSFLKTIVHQGLMTCHPGFLAPQNEVLWAKTRAQELAYLESNTFTADCDEQQVRLRKFGMAFS